MSRKLIYVSGLLSCFACHTEYGPEERGRVFAGSGAIRRAVTFFEHKLDRTPLETLSAVFLRYNHLGATADTVMGAYDSFLEELADESTRKELEELESDRQDNPTYKRLRNLSHDFRDGVLELFFDSDSGLPRTD